MENCPDESERLGFLEEIGIRWGMKLASALTALLVGMNALSGEDDRFLALKELGIAE